MVRKRQGKRGLGESSPDDAMAEGEEARPTSEERGETRQHRRATRRRDDGEALSGRPGTEPAPDAGDVEEPMDNREAEAISSEIQQELQELEELRERHLRLAAEFENYRKRTRRELAEADDRGQAELAGKLLEALDDLGRVAVTPADTTTVEALHEGVDLVQRKLLKALHDAGLDMVEAEGAPFDPNVHEALLSVPTSDPQEDNRVAQVLLPGYVFGDRLLRPARVVVQNFEADAEATDDPPQPGATGDEEPRRPDEA